MHCTNIQLTTLTPSPVVSDLPHCARSRRVVVCGSQVSDEAVPVRVSLAGPVLEALAQGVRVELGTHALEGGALAYLTGNLQACNIKKS